MTTACPGAGLQVWVLHRGGQDRRRLGTGRHRHDGQRAPRGRRRGLQVPPGAGVTD